MRYGIVVFAALFLAALIACGTKPPSRVPTPNFLQTVESKASNRATSVAILLTETAQAREFESLHPISTPTPTQSRVGWVGGERPVYVENRGIPTPTPVATPFQAKTTKEKQEEWSRNAATASERHRANQQRTEADVAATVRARPRITPTPVSMSQRRQYTALVNGYEPLTDENRDKVLDYLNTGVLNGRRLASYEGAWLTSGYADHVPVSFMARCLVEGFEYPTLTAELQAQAEHYGWDELVFLRDGSRSSFDEQMGINPDYVSRRYSPGQGMLTNWYTVKSMYRIGKGEFVRAYMGVNRTTCEPLNSRRGNWLDFYWEVAIGAYPRLSPKRSDSFGFHMSELKWDRSRMYDPITNAEVESGLIRCRDKVENSPYYLKRGGSGNCVQPDE